MEENDVFVQKLNSARSQLSKSAKEAGEWLISNLKKVTSPSKVFSKSATPAIGGMYLFTYDPKYKQTLPFYDMYPLVIPIEFYGNGFLGLNLHYLPPMARARLLDSLRKVAIDDKYSEKTKLNLSYDLLNLHARQFAEFKVCVKRYLFAHVRSTFHEVSQSEWDKAVMLPLQKWVVNSNKKYASQPPY